MTPFKLICRDPQGAEVNYLYQPHTSMLTHEDGCRIDLDSVGLSYDESPKAWEPAAIGHPDFPLGKNKSITTLKIQMGLKCNYSCAYCNQASQPHDVHGSLDDAQAFLDKLPSWFDGGVGGTGQGVTIEFWGGEPFVYWKTLKLLAPEMRKRYPDAHFNIITNGSVLDQEKVDFLCELGFGVGISHDGDAYEHNRGTDPLKNPAMLKWIKLLHSRLHAEGRLGFNCVLTKNNYSLASIRKYIAEHLEVPLSEVNLSTEEYLLPYDNSALEMCPQTEDDYQAMNHQVFQEIVTREALGVGTIRQKMEDFFKSISQARPAYVLGQKCGMDSPSALAVDVTGNVMTCQNTSAATKHKVGGIEAFEEIALTTAYHWTTRDECPKCPVVQLCRGACLFLEGEFWEKACRNSFEYNLTILAGCIHFLTGTVLTRVEGENIRYDGVSSVNSIDYDFVASGFTQKNWQSPVRRRMIPIVVAHA